MCHLQICPLKNFSNNRNADTIKLCWIPCASSIAYNVLMSVIIISYLELNVIQLNKTLAIHLLCSSIIGNNSIICEIFMLKPN